MRARLAVEDRADARADLAAALALAAPVMILPPVMRSYKQSAGQAFRHRFEGPVYRRIMMFGIKNFSHPMQRATMPFWAGIFYVLVPRARRAIEQNLERVLGPASAVETKARSFRLFVNYAQAITNMYCLHPGQPVPVEAITVGQEHISRCSRRSAAPSSSPATSASGRSRRS